MWSPVHGNGGPPRRWWPKQRRAMELLARRDLVTPLAAIAAEVGVRLATLQRWSTDPEFQKAVVERAREDIRACLPAAKDVLLKKALKEGDKECLKLIFRIAGLLADEGATPPADAARQELMSLSDAELLARARALKQWLEEEEQGHSPAC